ncbi:transporter substrate-binding domain-containing protein [uncultured Aquitalea sp.]|uniref:substrate-binding periplasmic protein n=1 Tax=uncultured Aquitalea sp. TaxID=540272 RepID=UPI0025DEAC96|nr:transporter substrate-binding domain-containing protein [uncultured Aquitalea sp.]
MKIAYSSNSPWALRLLGALAVCLAVCAAAQPLLVATDENLPPFSFVEGGKVVGVDVDMLREAARRAHVALDIQPMPWKRVLQELRQGDVPLASPLFRTPEREAFADYLGPVHISMLGLFVRKDRMFPFNKVDDLQGKRLGVMRGFVMQDELDAAIKAGRVQVEEGTTVEQNVGKLVLGRVDAFINNVASTYYQVRGTPAAQQIVVLPVLLQEHRPAFLAASKAARGAALPGVEALGKALQKQMQDGTYQKILAGYTGQ